jgi:hypothetical protein
MHACARARSTAACAGAQWLYSPWSACSAACGGDGTANRTAFCTPAGAGAASPGACDTGAQAAPFLQRSCAPASCGLTLWAAGPWGACSSPCNGARTQPVRGFRIFRTMDLAMSGCSLPCNGFPHAAKGFSLLHHGMCQQG